MKLAVKITFNVFGMTLVLMMANNINLIVQSNCDNDNVAIAGNSMITIRIRTATSLMVRIIYWLEIMAIG